MQSKKLRQLKKKKKTPILVGGTGLYYKALTEGLVEIPLIPLKLRNKIRLLQKSIGQEKFYRKLVKLDPTIINQVNSTDTQRSIRAYEVKLFTKKSVTEWYKSTKSKFKKNDFFKLYIDYPRLKLIEKINLRTSQMLDIGAILEVKKFLKLKVPKSKSISKAIGVAEIKDFINKKMIKEEVVEKISIKTRQYAKRQATWARGHMTSWKKIKPKSLNRFLNKI